MRRTVSSFLLALEFLTVLRVRRVGDYAPSTVGAALPWFPVVGVLIGAVLVGVDLAAAALVAPGVTVALVLAANALLTGALHLDGLADTADGVFGGRTPEGRLEIMRDSRIGSFGVVAVILVLLLQYAALTSVTDSLRRAVLLAAPVLARFAIVAAIVAFPYVRPAGLGRTFKDHAPPFALPVAGTVALLVSIALFGPSGATLAAVAAAIAWLSGGFLRRRLGGLTGDTYGAIVVLTEAVLFLIVSADPDRQWLHW